MAKIKIEVAGAINLLLALQQAVDVLATANINADGKSFIYYAVLTVADADSESAITLLRNCGIRASPIG